MKSYVIKVQNKAKKNCEKLSNTMNAYFSTHGKPTEFFFVSQINFSVIFVTAITHPFLLYCSTSSASGRGTGFCTNLEIPVRSSLGCLLIVSPAFAVSLLDLLSVSQMKILKYFYFLDMNKLPIYIWLSFSPIYVASNNNTNFRTSHN